MLKIESLNGEWNFKANKKKSSLKEIPLKWIKTKQWLKAKVPGTVHTDLLKNKLIPDPFLSDNEIKLKWINDLDWIYKKEFDFPKNFLRDKKTFIVFEGLDTIAEIFLNGNKIGSSQNMFCEYKFEISKILKKKNNKLEIFFLSPLDYSRNLESKYGKLPVALNSERVYIRKAQYSFGWDWGPSFPTSGIWKNVFLIQGENDFIEDFYFKTISIYEKNAEVEISGKIISSEKNKSLVIKLYDASSSFEFSFPITENHFSHKFSIPNPKLWFPNGFGEPNLYNLQIQLQNGNEIIDEKIIKVGIRKIELQLNENSKKTFRFIVNGKPVFAKGADWIPADSFLPEISDDKYRTLLTFAKNANMNMIRVWGGGIYENNIFYELCDKLGLMVWQDFMFACASYPEFDEFLLNVEEEVRQNINRLKNHPCITIWCGNNENEWLWFQQQKKSYKEMPGYKVYSKLIPDILRELNISQPYWQSSPFGDEEDPNSVLSGNRHQWEMWSRWIDYEKVIEDESLFVTEFGFQGPANQKTLEKVIPENQRMPQSYLFEFHNKQIEGNERVFKFLTGHLPVKTNWKDFIYLAQLSQGLALKTCIEHWRLNFPKTNGSIIWQLNDCWPVTSWSLIDSELKPKPSYYLTKESFNDQIIILKKNGKSLEAYILNHAGNDEEIIIKIQLIDLMKSKVESIISKKVKIFSNEKKLTSSISLSDMVLNGGGIIISSIYNLKNQLIHRNYYIEKEWKHMELPKAKIKIKDDKNKKFIEITSNKPAFFVSIEQTGKNENLIFKKNGLIILPGEKIYIEYDEIAKSKNRKFSAVSLNDHLIH